MTNKKKRTQRIYAVCLVLTAAVLSVAALTKTKKENKTYA